jgi:hypothetical protein
MYILYYVYTPRTDVYNVYDTDMSVAKLMKNHRRDLLFHFLFPTMDVVVFCFYISRARCKRALKVCCCCYDVFC